MSYFFCRLNPPRPNFMQNMSPVEMSLMQQHGAYWKTFFDKGTAILFGPVADPKGEFGVAIVEANAEPDVRTMTEGDPVIKSNSGFRYEILFMPRAIVRPHVAAAGAQAHQ